jgi:hypothetical protein
LIQYEYDKVKNVVKSDMEYLPHGTQNQNGQAPIFAQFREDIFGNMVTVDEDGNPTAEDEDGNPTAEDVIDLCESSDDDVSEEMARRGSPRARLGTATATAATTAAAIAAAAAAAAAAAVAAAAVAAVKKLVAEATQSVLAKEAAIAK